MEPNPIPTAAMPFTPEMEAAYAKARARLDAGRLKQLLFDITDIHSPTGATRTVAEFVAERMQAVGLKPTLDPMGDISANVLGEKRGSGGGATLLGFARQGGEPCEQEQGRSGQDRRESRVPMHGSGFCPSVAAGPILAHPYRELCQTPRRITRRTGPGRRARTPGPRHCPSPRGAPSGPGGAAR